jgi:hypothetical protein
MIINGSTVWTAEVTTGGDWISLQNDSGNSYDTVDFDVDANRTGATRTGTITISASGAHSRTITINQPNATLNVNPTTVSVVSDATTGNTSTVTTNASWWNASPTDNWISLTKNSGTSGEKVTFNVAANPTSSARSGSITVTAVDATETLWVNQAGAAAISVSPDSYAFPAAGGTKSDFIITATNFTGTPQVSKSGDSDGSWLTTSINGSALTVTAAANTSTTARSATITLTADGATAQVTITQVGATSNPYLELDYSGMDIVNMGDYQWVTVAGTITGGTPPYNIWVNGDGFGTVDQEGPFILTGQLSNNSAIGHTLVIFVIGGNSVEWTY